MTIKYYLRQCVLNHFFTIKLFKRKPSRRYLLVTFAYYLSFFCFLEILEYSNTSLLDSPENATT